jgi:hypothetical protein
MVDALLEPELISEKLRAGSSVDDAGHDRHVVADDIVEKSAWSDWSTSVAMWRMSTGCRMSVSSFLAQPLQEAAEILLLAHSGQSFTTSCSCPASG